MASRSDEIEATVNSVVSECGSLHFTLSVQVILEFRFNVVDYWLPAVMNDKYKYNLQ